MRIKALKIFCDVAKHQSVSKGAEINRVTQSSISQLLRSFEKDLGVKLIDRSRRPFQLTGEGRIFLEGCREIVNRYTDLMAELKTAGPSLKPLVKVACIYSVGLKYMSICSETFSQTFPSTGIKIEYLHPHRVYESVLEEDADLGIVSFPQPSRELSLIRWRDEQMVLACHPEHPLAGRKRIAIGKISGEDFVGFDRDLVIRTEVDRHLRRNRVEVKTVLEFDNVESIKRAVETGSGVSILPGPTLEQEVRAGTLAAVGFSKRDFVRPLGIIHLRKRELNDSVNGFIEILKKETAWSLH